MVLDLMKIIFKSFLESDSTYKAKIGGKGVGRFSWLKAFEEVEIQSVYKEYDDKFVQLGLFVLESIARK